MISDSLKDVYGEAELRRLAAEQKAKMSPQLKAKLARLDAEIRRTASSKRTTGGGERGGGGMIADTIPRCQNSCAAGPARLEAFLRETCRHPCKDGDCADCVLAADDRDYHRHVDETAVRQEAAEMLAEMPTDEPEEEPCS
jgi:hypothetical protein